MKSWKTIGLFFLVLGVSGLIFSCSDKGSDKTAKESGKILKGYQIEYWFEKDEEKITEYEKMIKKQIEWLKNYKEGRTGLIVCAEGQLYAEEGLNNLRKELKRIEDEIKILKVKIRGPAAGLFIMITDPSQEGVALYRDRIGEGTTIDNIEIVKIRFRYVGSEGWRIDSWEPGQPIIRPGVYSLVVKKIAPEEVIYKVAIELPPTDKLVVAKAN